MIFYRRRGKTVYIESFFLLSGKNLLDFFTFISHIYNVSKLKEMSLIRKEMKNNNDCISKSYDY